MSDKFSDFYKNIRTQFIPEVIEYREGCYTLTSIDDICEIIKITNDSEGIILEFKDNVTGYQRDATTNFINKYAECWGYKVEFR